MATAGQVILHILGENAPAIRRYGVGSLSLFGSSARGAGRQ
jgi:predicted nucleotidyltransferase